MLLHAALRDLEHADPRVRAQAADALGRADVDDRVIATTALARAADDAHPSVRYAALLSLGELAAADAVDVLARHVEDEEPLCREAAAIALGQLGPDGGDAAWQALTRALSSPANEVRFQAIASLVEIDATRAAPLVLAATHDRDAKVRAQAAAALGDVGVEAGRDEVAYRDRLRALLDDVADVQFEAALALARLGDRGGVPTLVAALAHKDRALDAATQLAQLGLDGDAAATAALTQIVSRFFGDPLVKVRAAEALAKASDPRGLLHLRRAAKARRDDVRGLAQSVLSELGHGAR